MTGNYTSGNYTSGNYTSGNYTEILVNKTVNNIYGGFKLHWPPIDDDYDKIFNEANFTPLLI